MMYKSSRDGVRASLTEALLAGLAPDGGLYVPEQMPRFRPEDFADCETDADFARCYLAPFFAGSELAEQLPAICAETFHFPIPLAAVSTAQTKGRLSVLELFHGPTAAFKDVGAGFLAACMARITAADDAGAPVLVLVATSGDTGGAVAAAFHRRAGFEVAVLFPAGRVSARQQQQLTCWGDNVRAFSVDGSFDDCQRLVKAAFTDAELAARFRLSSANSINIGRLLPQSVYYAKASVSNWRESGEALSLLIPTGNLGNGLAAVLARAAGCPIGEIVFVTNANRSIPDFLASGELDDRASTPTLASAMDVGNPSNLERLRSLYGEAEALRTMISAVSVDDTQIRAAVRETHNTQGMTLCPHTATAMHAWRGLPDNVRQANHWAVVATAHPAKFESIVEPLVGESVPVPPALAALLDKPAHYQSLAPTLDALREALG